MIKTNVLNFKKGVAVFIAMLMMVWLFSYTTNNYSDAANSSLTYRVYNAKTGGFLRTYTLAPLETDDNSRAVIGDDDDRVIDWTKSGVVKIMNSSYYLGSGFIVGRHTIATAAHCLCDYKNGNSKIVSEILLFDTNGNVSLHATPVEYHLPTTFVNNAVANNGKDNYNSESDYALITVKEDLSAYMCFDLGAPLDSFKDKNATVTVTGFPKEHNTYTNHMKYSGNGEVSNITNNLLYHKADTSGGNSGSPVFLTESLQGKTYYTVVAINIAGSKANIENIGTRITTDLIHFYKSSKNLNY